MADRVVLFETSQGANQGVARGERLIAGGFMSGPNGNPSTVTINTSSGNIDVATTAGGSNLSLTAVNQIVLNGTSVLINCDIDAGSHKIHNLADPTSAQDAATKNYIDTTIVSGGLIKADGSVAFTGNESMGGHKLTNVAAPTTGTDATNKTYADAQDAATLTAAEAYSDSKEVLDVRLDGSRLMTGALDMNTHKIVGVVNPTAAQDAATKNYVDTAVSGASSLAFTDINYTGGVEGYNTGSYVNVTGVSITFTLSGTRTVLFFASGASLADPFTQGNYIGLAIHVSGTDYPLNGTGEQGFNAAGGGNLVTGGFTGGNAISAEKTLTLTAGVYTVQLRAIGFGYLESSTTFPTRLTAVYLA